MDYEIYQTGSSVLPFLSANNINYVLIYKGEEDKALINSLKYIYPDLMICTYENYLKSPRYLVWTPYLIRKEGNTNFVLPNVYSNDSIKKTMLSSINSYIKNWNRPSKFVYQLMLGLIQIINKSSELNYDQQQLLYVVHLNFTKDTTYQALKDMYNNYINEGVF